MAVDVIYDKNGKPLLRLLKNGRLVSFDGKNTGFWTNKSKENNFLLIMHEHMFVFRKPEGFEKLEKFRESMI